MSQKSVSLSTYEAETMAGSAASSEGIWANRIKMDMMPEETFRAIDLGLDNQSSLEASQNPITQGKAKHIDIREHKLREDVKTGLVRTYKVPGTDNVADILTKVEAKPMFTKMRDRVVGSLKMLIAWSAWRKVKAITWFYGVGRTELPTIVDTGCAPYSAISESMLAQVTYPSIHRERLEEDLIVEDATGGTIIVKEVVKLTVTAKAHKGYVKFVGKAEIKFVIIPRKDQNLVLLGENLLEAFAVEDPEEQIWEKLVGASESEESEEEDENNHTATDNQRNTASSVIPESTPGVGLAHAQNSETYANQPAASNQLINMSLLQVQFNINKLIEAKTNLEQFEQDLLNQGQRGWAGRAGNLANIVELAVRSLRGAALKAEDQVHAKLEQVFADEMARLVASKEELQVDQPNLQVVAEVIPLTSIQATTSPVDYDPSRLVVLVPMISDLDELQPLEDEKGKEEPTQELPKPRAKRARGARE